MIQLATDPNAARSNWRPAPAEAKDGADNARRSRSGHAWPFISRYDERPAAQQQSRRAPNSQSGS
jgi:hypothetical protein